MASRNGAVELLEVEAAVGWDATWDDTTPSDLTVTFTRGSDVAEVRVRVSPDGAIQHSTSIRTTTDES